MKKQKKLENILSCVDDNKQVFSIGYAVLVVIAVGVLGYGLGASNQAAVSSKLSAETLELKSAKQVLGDRIAPFYVNPFDGLEAKEIKFPIAQLRECRNWEECRTLCSKPANFQQCAAWSKAQ